MKGFTKIGLILGLAFLLIAGVFATTTVFANNNHHHDEHHCERQCGPTATPTPTEEVTPTPTIDPCQVEAVIKFGDDENPCATPTPTPTDECQFNCGGGNVPSNPSTNTTQAPGAAVCDVAFDKPLLQGFHADGNGSVTFSWWGVAGVDKYSIRYGYKPDALVYGADNIPANSTSFQINGLNVGSNVWAIVSAWKGGCAEDSNLLDPKVK